MPRYDETLSVEENNWAGPPWPYVETLLAAIVAFYETEQGVVDGLALVDDAGLTDAARPLVASAMYAIYRLAEIAASAGVAPEATDVIRLLLLDLARMDSDPLDGLF